MNVPCRRFVRYSVTSTGGPHCMRCADGGPSLHPSQRYISIRSRARTRQRSWRSASHECQPVRTAANMNQRYHQTARESDQSALHQRGIILWASTLGLPENTYNRRSGSQSETHQAICQSQSKRSSPAPVITAAKHPRQTHACQMRGDSVSSVRQLLHCGRRVGGRCGGVPW